MTERPDDGKGQDERDDGENGSTHGPFWHERDRLRAFP